MTNPNPTGPLTDHELAHTLAALPDHFTAVRLAKEVARHRELLGQLRAVLDSTDTAEAKLTRVAAVIGGGE